MIWGFPQILLRFYRGYIGEENGSYYLEFEVWGLGNWVFWFPKIVGTSLGLFIIRTIVFWGLYWGSPILGNYYLLDFQLHL